MVQLHHMSGEFIKYELDLFTIPLTQTLLRKMRIYKYHLYRYIRLISSGIFIGEDYIT